MKFFISSLLVFYSFSASAQNAAVCPLGPKDSKLTLQRVMRNFDKYTRFADSLVLRGLQDPGAVTDQDLNQVQNDFQIVIACVNAVIAANGDDLIPAKAGDLRGDEQKSFFDLYLSLMQKLKVMTENYSAEFAHLQALEISERNFQQLAQFKKAYNHFIDEAHDHF